MPILVAAGTPTRGISQRVIARVGPARIHAFLDRGAELFPDFTDLINGPIRQRIHIEDAEAEDLLMSPDGPRIAYHWCVRVKEGLEP